MRYSVYAGIVSAVQASVKAFVSMHPAKRGSAHAATSAATGLENTLWLWDEDPLMKVRSVRVSDFSGERPCRAPATIPSAKRFPGLERAPSGRVAFLLRQT